MIIGRDARVAVLRERLAHWKTMRRLAAKEGRPALVAACEVNAAYFRTALSQEIPA